MPLKWMGKRGEIRSGGVEGVVSVMIMIVTAEMTVMMTMTMTVTRKV